MESAVIGKTHGDTFTAYNDLDMLKRQFPDANLPQVKAIEVYTDGSLCFGYEFFYVGNVQVGHHIGVMVHPEVRCERFELNQGEYLVRVGGQFGDICDGLSFVTSQDRTFKVGGSGGSALTCDTKVMDCNGAACEMKAAVKPYILAIGVGMGGHVHHMKCSFIDLA